MPIYRGTNKIGELYFNGNKIGKAYLGSNLVYQSVKAIYLGYISSITLTTSIYKDFKSITINDFFISPTEGELVRTIYHCKGWDGSSCTGGCSDVVSDTATFSKTWDVNTGVFNCTMGGKPVYVWIIPNSSKLISSGVIKKVGTGQTFTVTSIAPDYRTCTKNNFLFRTLNSATSSFQCCSYQCGNDVNFDKSYTASSGELVAKNRVGRQLSAGSLDTTPYYIPTSIIS